MASDFKPNVVKRIETFSLDAEEIRDLIQEGLMHRLFLDGRPGTAQTLNIRYDFGCCTPRAMAVLETLEQEYTER